MTMFLAPYTAIADIDGNPLDAGFLFFGEYGKDPELFPVEVFWDADFTVPAAQPIRTRNGYPVRNGSPAKVYLKVAQHSIAIKNRKGAFVLVDFHNKGWDVSFVVDGDKTQKQINDNQALINDNQALINNNLVALNVNVFDFMTQEQIDSVLSFDKTADLRAPIDAAQIYVFERGGGTVNFPYGLYAIKGFIRRYPKVSLKGDVNQPIIENTTSPYNFINSTIFLEGNFHPEWVGVLVPKSCGTTNVGDTVTLTSSSDASEFNAGDDVLIISNEKYESTSIPGLFVQKFLFCNEVLSKTGSTLKLKYPIDASFDGGIVKLDGSQLARNGIPLFFCKNSTVENFKLKTLGYYMSDSATLNCQFKNLHLISAKQMVYGNTFQRTVFDGITGIVTSGLSEMSLCSLRSEVKNFNVSLVSSGGSNHGISIQENARYVKFKDGTVDFGANNLASSPIALGNAASCSFKDIKFTQSAVMTNSIITMLETGAVGRIKCTDNTVDSIEYDGYQCPRYYTLQGDNAGNVTGNTIKNSKFKAQVTSNECGRITNTDVRNTILNCEFESGLPIFGATTSNQEFIDCYVGGGLSSTQQSSYNVNLLRNIRTPLSAVRSNAISDNTTTINTSSDAELQLINRNIGQSLRARDKLNVSLRSSISGAGGTKVISIGLINVTDSTSVPMFSKTFDAATIGQFKFSFNFYVASLDNITWTCSVSNNMTGVVEEFGGVVTSNLVGKDLSISAKAKCNASDDSMSFREVSSDLVNPYLI